MVLSMGLQRELTNTGNWLFRWRSFLPVTVVVCAVIAMLPIPQPRHDGLIADSIEIVSLGISFLGMLIRAMTVGHTPAGTSGRNTAGQVAESLNTTGIYSTVRHPLYLANFLIGLGLSCFTLTWWFPLMYTLTFWLYYERIMLAEEVVPAIEVRRTVHRVDSTNAGLHPSWKNYTPPKAEVLNAQCAASRIQHVAANCRCWLPAGILRRLV
jgi:protein-S-isoprenylcysteine O-methyltransferase Ste14